MANIGYRTEIFADTTNSTAFVDLDNGSINFNLAGSGRRCVLVTLSVETNVSADNAGIDVQVLLNNVTKAQPGIVQWVRDHDEDGDGPAEFRAHSFQFAFPRVAPGFHTIKVQWRSTHTASTATFSRRTITVYY